MATYDDNHPGGEQREPGASSQAAEPGKQSLISAGSTAAVQRRGLLEGKQTIIPALPFSSPVQQRASTGAEIAASDAATQDQAWRGLIQMARGGQPANGAAAVHTAAAQGVASRASPLPHRAEIQRSFGHHDISAIQAHTGPEAAGSARAMGADAFATGNHVVLGGRSDLHTVAHEAAHVVQQRGGVQLKGGVGSAGDTYERHADAVADRVVAGQSAQDLLDGVGTGGATRSVQRKEGKDDAKILENQASLKGTDVEIPALEGALLATRLEAVKQGFLSQASFDAGLALSQAMTRLSPAVEADGAIDVLLQETAAIAAHRLFAALRAETSDDKNFKTQPTQAGGTAHFSQNPYTEEVRVTTWFSQATRSSLEQLPVLIRQRKWGDAFVAYRQLLDGLDLWVADQLRKKGKGTPEEARGNAHQHNAQLRTGLEQIAGKHATRVPALFHPDADTLAKEKAAGRPVADAIPMNVYFWKDEKDGKFHLYDLTTPSRPHEQTIDGSPTAAMMNTFFEEVARYPEGEVRYTLPDGASGVAATTGKTKWYEWVGYAGLAAAAVGLAFVTAGASVPATVCFAAGALAGGLSAAGHLVDTAQLGTATTATVVLDVAQLAASFASFGALAITLKAGGAAAALAGSRWFVPLVKGAVIADGVQLVALTDITYVELTKIQQGAGTAEDKQRATAVLLTQLTVMGGLTALSVKGAHDARALSGKPLELVEQNRSSVLRVVGDDARPPADEDAVLANGSQHPPPHSHDPTTSQDVGEGYPNPMAHDGPIGGPPNRLLANAPEPRHWIARLESALNAEEQAKFAKMKAGKTPQELYDMFAGDLDAARDRIRTAVRIEQEHAAVATQSKERVADLRKQIADRGLMNDPEIRDILSGRTARNPQARLGMLRDKLVAKILQGEMENANPDADVLSSVKIYEKLPEVSVEEWKSNHPGQLADGLVRREGELYMQRGEMDLTLLERPQTGKAKVIAREEVKTGVRDTNADARRQLQDQSALLHDAAIGKKTIRLEFEDRDITSQIDLASDALASKSTRGPARKGFDKNLGVSGADLEAMCKDLMKTGTTSGEGAQ
jgi:hypothetical protein